MRLLSERLPPALSWRSRALTPNDKAGKPATSTTSSAYHLAQPIQSGYDKNHPPGNTHGKL
jgi:hypothetical protein